MNTAAARNAGVLLERIMEDDAIVHMVEIGESKPLVDLFARLARRQGQTLYCWRPGAGLISLREGEVQVPGCQRTDEVLRYILNSMHFGIFLLCDMETPLSVSDLALLRQIARTETRHVRRVVLLGTDVSLAREVQGARLIRRREHAQVRPRLRDGRWVV